MRKISLDVDALEVESFETVGDDAEERGTVHANWGRTQSPSVCRTYCGSQCPSGPMPCEGSVAWTDGYNACPCDWTVLCVETDLCA